MHADDVVDDEFNAGQADAFIRQLREVESQLGVADVHHNLDRNFWQFTQITRRDFVFLRATVHMTGIAFGTRDRNDFTFGQSFGGIATTNDCRNT